MSVKNSPEERMLISLIGKLPMEEADKTSWVEQIQENGMTEELVDLIHEKLAAPLENDPNPARHTRMRLDFSRLVNRWRLASQRKNFKR